jgi:hypothetical protein
MEPPPPDGLPPTAPPTGESLALDRDPEPIFDFARPTAPATPSAASRTGGVGLGLDLEPRESSVALGPRLDLGAGFDDLAVIATQVLRVGAADSTVLFDTRLGCGWGAPFSARRSVGLVVAGGVQGLSGVGREITTPGRRTDSTVILGGVVALPSVAVLLRGTSARM